MKKMKFYSILASLLLTAGISFADAGFTGMAGGSSGFAGVFKDDDVEFDIPFNAFAAVQLNFGSWGIFRANLGLASKNLTEGNLFKGQDAILRMNECSLTLIKTSEDVKNYFGFYMGTYEVAGKDEYLQRHFGIEPISSLLTKSATTLSCGVPIYDNEGAGFSYTMHFAKAPGTLGFNIYFNTLHDSDLKFNFDIRTAWVTNLLTIDISGGIGTPIKNDADAYVLIDTLYLHGGVSLLFGSTYTSSLFIQGGIQNVSLTHNGSGAVFDAGKDISILVEPRIYTKSVKVRLAAFSIPKEFVSDFLYLEDTLGAAVTVFSDAASTKNSNITIGAHLIGSIEDGDFVKLIDGFYFKTTNYVLNTYITPFIDVPVANGTLEFMGQFGVCNILDTPYIKAKAKIGYRRAF